MMMYSSMDLQAMYTGVISKYIQNSSLKVFEEILLAFSFFLIIFLKSSILTASQKEKMSCIFGGIADSKSRVPLFYLLYG